MKNKIFILPKDTPEARKFVEENPTLKAGEDYFVIPAREPERSQAWQSFIEQYGDEFAKTCATRCVVNDECLPDVTYTFTKTEKSSVDVIRSLGNASDSIYRSDLFRILGATYEQTRQNLDEWQEEQDAPERGSIPRPDVSLVQTADGFMLNYTTSTLKNHVHIECHGDDWSIKLETASRHDIGKSTIIPHAKAAGFQWELTPQTKLHSDIFAQFPTPEKPSIEIVIVGVRKPLLFLDNTPGSDVGNDNIPEYVRREIDAKINDAYQNNNVRIIDVRGIDGLDPGLTLSYTSHTTTFEGDPTVLIGDNFVSYYCEDIDNVWSECIWCNFDYLDTCGFDYDGTDCTGKQGVWICDNDARKLQEALDIIGQEVGIDFQDCYKDEIEAQNRDEI